jgi:predicted DNA-binding transcriptional regulator AlpA
MAEKITTIHGTSEVTAAKLLRPGETASVCGISLRSLWRLVASEEFVPPIRISSRIVRFRLGDVLDWIEAKKGNSHDQF